jgi:hypothetical protein
LLRLQPQFRSAVHRRAAPEFPEAAQTSAAPAVSPGAATGCTAPSVLPGWHCCLLAQRGRQHQRAQYAQHKPRRKRLLPRRRCR